MLIMSLRIRVPSHAVPHIVGLFESYRGPVSVRAGCSSVNLYEHPSSTGDFILLAEWNSEGALEAHVRSDDFRKVLAIMDLADEPPELKFNTVSSARGFELVEEIRREQASSEVGLE